MKLKKKTAHNDFMRDDGNGIYELIVAFKYKKMGGSSQLFQVYTYNGKNLVCQLNVRQYGYDKVRYSRSSKAFRVYQAARGEDIFYYYKLKRGKYECVAVQGRTTFGTNRAWTFYDGKKNKISKASFMSRIAGTQNGKLYTFSVYGKGCYSVR